MKLLKKVLALLAVLLIIALYGIVIYCAIFIDKVGSQTFMTALVAAVSLPLLLYLVFWLSRLFRSKQPPEEESRAARTKKGFQEAAVFNKGIGKKRQDETEGQAVLDEGDKEE